MNETCKALNNEVEFRKSRIVHWEHYYKNANIGITRIPLQANEDLPSVLEQFDREIGELITLPCLEMYLRVPVAYTKTNKNVVVQFITRTKRNMALEKTRKHRLPVGDLDFTTQSPIYINEHLCSELKKFLGQATTKNKKRMKYLCRLV